MWWEWYAKKKAEIKNSMQRGVLLSLEKSIEIRNEIENQEAKFEEMLKGKEQKSVELLILNDNLRKSLESKESEVEELQRQLREKIIRKSSKINVSPKDTFPFPVPSVSKVEFEDNKSGRTEESISGKPSEITKTSGVQSRVLLPADKFVEATLENYLNADPIFNGMKFMVDVKDRKIAVSRFPKSLNGKSQTYNYYYSEPEDGGTMYFETERIKALLKKDMLSAN